MDYYVPEETEILLRNRSNECKNLGLLLDKYIPISVFEKPDKNDKNKGKTPWLTFILEPMSAKDKGKKQNRHIDAELVQHVYQRWSAMIRAIGARHFQATLDWRMVIGLGGETVLETDLTLHHLYGIPYVPASALKGLTRAYVTGEVFPSGNIEDDNDTVKRIFGTQKEAGTVLFFDAMPVEGQAAFVIDIMNPHYPDYYRSKQNPLPPTDDQSPNPVAFLTVTDTTFMFALAPRNFHAPQHRKDVEKVEEWLRLALGKYGIGAKTSAGYGYFKESSQSNSKALETDKQVQPSMQTQPTSTQSEAQHRPNLPKFHEGQELLHNCTVVVPTDSMRQLYPTASAYLRYQEFSTRDIFIAIEASTDEVENWKPGETRGCIIIRIEEHSSTLVPVCKPRPKKNKQKNK